MKSLEKLKGICYRRAYALYGEKLFGRYKSRIEYELERIRSIPNGAEAFWQTQEFIGTIKNLWRSLKGCSPVGDAKPRLTFRGPVLAGFVAYLCGITEYDPMEWEFYAWTFFMRTKGIEFNLDVTLGMYDLIREYDIAVPSCVILRIDVDQSVLEEAEAYGVSYRCDIHNSGETLREINREIEVFFREVMENDQDALKYIWNEEERKVSEVEPILNYLCGIDQLPESLWNLVRLNGFLHNTLHEGTRLQVLRMVPQIYVDDGIIAYPENIYETLWKKGYPRESAQRIARTVQSANRTITKQDQAILEEHCGRTYALMAAGTKHLFYKAQVFGKTIGSAELMRWYNHDPEILRDAYARVMK